MRFGWPHAVSNLKPRRDATWLRVPTAYIKPKFAQAWAQRSWSSPGSGQSKPSSVGFKLVDCAHITCPHREIIAAADAYLADHRAELIAEATPIVERRQAEGFFGKRSIR
jgi:hypothetical protein